MSYVKNCLVLLFLTVGLQNSLFAQRIAATSKHAALLCESGRLFSWGVNSDAQLGDGTVEARNGAVQVLGESNYQSISCGPHCTYGVTLSGSVEVWGSIFGYLVGVPSIGFRESKPRLIPYTSSVSQVFATDYNVYYLLRDSTVIVSGLNFEGSYGDGTSEILDSGFAKTKIKGVVGLFPSAGYCFAILADGSLMAWGSNADRLIDPSAGTSGFSIPTRITPETKFVTGCVTYNIGNYGSARFVTDSGKLIVWGNNTYKQLGLDEDTVRVPTSVALPGRCVKIVGGERHTLALLEDGSVWAWGDNSKGQLGNYSVSIPSMTSTPVQCIGLEHVVEIAAAGFTSYAITKNGTLYGWGDNEARQLNRDDAPRQYTPVNIPLPCYIVSGVYDESATGSTAVYSNPATNELILELPAMIQNSGSNALVTIYSLQGVMVNQSAWTVTPTLHLDVAGLAPGSYVVRIEIGHSIYYSTFAKLR